MHVRQGRAVNALLCTSSSTNTSNRRLVTTTTRTRRSAAAGVCRALRRSGRDSSRSGKNPRADSTTEGHVHSACTTTESPSILDDQSAAIAGVSSNISDDDFAQDILGPSSASSVSFKLNNNSNKDDDDSYVQQQQQSSHPDAIKRRLKAERRRERRNTVSDSLSKGSAWWKIECAANMVVVATSDDFYCAFRTARQQQRDVVVQYFSPSCFACKEEALHCAQIASQNPETMFIRVHYDRCRAVSDVHNIKKLPWVQYYKHSSSGSHTGSDSSAEENKSLVPCFENVHLSAFNHLLQVPSQLRESGSASSKYCVMSPSLKEIDNFDTLLQAIYL